MTAQYNKKQKQKRRKAKVDRKQTKERDEFLARELIDLEKSAVSLQSIIVELEKTIDPLLKERLAQALEKFQKDTEQTAETAIEKSQGELAEKLESMLHLLRKQAKHS